MSLDEALATFSEALLRGDVSKAADQVDALTALADQLRDSEQRLRRSQDDLLDSQADFRQSQDDLHQSQADLRQSQDDLHHSQADAQSKGEEIYQLHRALESRDIIGQAKGVLMERFNINAAAAFEMLVQLSKSSNTRLNLIAQKLVELDHPPGEPIADAGGIGVAKAGRRRRS